jgi:hypothetical protein
MMTTQAGDLVLDPMSGSGTTAEASRRLGRRAIICDHSDEYTKLAEKRLGVSRIKLPHDLRACLEACEFPLLPDWRMAVQSTAYQARNGDVAHAHQMAFFEKAENNGSRKKSRRG